MSEHLKPCPHCGGRAEWGVDPGNDARVVFCLDCHIGTTHHIEHEEYWNDIPREIEEATRAWNRRALPDEVRALVSSVIETWGNQIHRESSVGAALAAVKALFGVQDSFDGE